jgi:hypothetical protein
LQSPSCFSLMQLGQPKEGENSWLALSSVLLPCYSNIKTSTFGFLRSKSEDDLQPRRGEWWEHNHIWYDHVNSF